VTKGARAFRRAFALTALVVCVVGGVTAGVWWRLSAADRALVATVHRGTLTAVLTTTGTLKPIQSITYRSPLAGREAEIVELAPEGGHAKAGDLVALLDTTELQRDLSRAKQDVQQARMDVVVAEIEKQEADAAVKGVAEGEGALAVAEARTRLQAAERKAVRLRQEYAQLKPLLERGFITREELKRTEDELEQAEQDLALAKKRDDVAAGLTHPRETQHASLQLAQKQSQLENARSRAIEADGRLHALNEQIEHCRIVARRPGIVVYEEVLGANPRRKIHIGDRVTASQGLITIPEVNRMLLEASVSEADMRRVHAGQRATVRVEAFPDRRLAGTVARVGTLARASADRPFDEKRFDLIVELDAPDADLRPEMTARADVLIGTRANVVLAPINAVFDDNGAMVAHVRGRTGLATRPVEVGETDGVSIEIVKGLDDGDDVMLSAPARASGSRDAQPR